MSITTPPLSERDEQLVNAAAEVYATVKYARLRREAITKANGEIFFSAVARLSEKLAAAGESEKKVLRAALAPMAKISCPVLSEKTKDGELTEWLSTNSELAREIESILNEPGRGGVYDPEARAKQDRFWSSYTKETTEGRTGGDGKSDIPGRGSSIG